MTKPIRVQLSRRKGFRLAEAAGNGLPTVKVDRTTKWGNQYQVHQVTPTKWEVFLSLDGRYSGPCIGYRQTRREATQLSVEAHRALITGPEGDLLRAVIQRELRGKNLACWCALPKPGGPDICHRAVLLEIADGCGEPET